MQTIGVEPVDGVFAGFMKVTSFDAFLAVVERVGIAIASRELKFLACLRLPVEMPSVQLKIGRAME